MTVLPANLATPLVVDLNGDGIQTVAIDASSARFDLLANGQAVRSGWVSNGDGLLANDTNGNGVIDDGSELFGGALGEGFAELNAFDTNYDGLVNAADANFADLKIWQDTNGNHRTDAGELASLTQHGIAALSTRYTIEPEEQHGNWLLERGSATRIDGTRIDMADAYFELGKPEAPASSASPIHQPALHAALAQPAEFGLPGLPFGNERRAQFDPVTDWTAHPDSSILGADRDERKKDIKRSSWLTGFIGAEKETKRDAASLSKLSVKLPAGKGRG